MAGQSYIMAAAAAVLAASPGVAKPVAPKAPPAQFQQLMACRAIADAGQRLACFDQQTAAVASALEHKELVLIDKQQAREAKRGLFGFSAPNLSGIFGGDDEEVKQIEGTVASAALNGDGTWTVRLKDGSVWLQTDDRMLPEPRPGQKVVVKRGALGSFRLNVGGGASVKAKRVG